MDKITQATQKTCKDVREVIQSVDKTVDNAVNYGNMAYESAKKQLEQINGAIDQRATQTEAYVVQRVGRVLAAAEQGVRVLEAVKAAVNGRAAKLENARKNVPDRDEQAGETRQSTPEREMQSSWKRYSKYLIGAAALGAVALGIYAICPSGKHAKAEQPIQYHAIERIEVNSENVYGSYLPDGTKQAYVTTVLEDGTSASCVSPLLDKRMIERARSNGLIKR